MSDVLLQAKLRPPPLSSGTVFRPRLIETLEEGHGGSVTLISAPAGFGKSTLLAEWAAESPRSVAWLSLDEGDNDLTTYLTALVAALRCVRQDVGEGLLSLLRSPQMPEIGHLLTPLVNELTSLPTGSSLVLDDLHLLQEPRPAEALLFLVEHLPPSLHLLLSTREDPPLPLSRLRARGRLRELRGRDLRFTESEARTFFAGMGLSLDSEEINLIKERTEGWIAGLQLAAISLREEEDPEKFLRSFTGTHRFVLDYLIEEVLQRQPEEVHRFLLSTSLLTRLCGPLCDALLAAPEGRSQTVLERLERSNLFLIPLDEERRWYRYHHLFGDLLRHRLHQQRPQLEELHHRASVWFEEQGLILEAFNHAVAAGDRERAIRLSRGDGTPLHLQGGVTQVLQWLETLPDAFLDEQPELWVRYASALSTVARKDEVKEKLRRAEAALADGEPGPATDDLAGQLAAIRAMEAAGAYDVQTLVTESLRALELLAPDNLPPRISATWTLGFAHQIRGERAAAREAYQEAISLSRASGNLFMEILAATGLGIIQESENELSEAAATFERAVGLVGGEREPALCEAHLGLGRIAYQRNDLDLAAREARKGYDLAAKIPVVDTYIACTLLQAHVALAAGRVPEAESLLETARGEATRGGFEEQLSSIGELEVRLILRSGQMEEASRRARAYALAEGEARSLLAAGEAAGAAQMLRELRGEAEAAGRRDKLLRLTLLEAAARGATGEVAEAEALLSEVVTVAERGGFFRLFLDEGEAVQRLLSDALDSDLPELAQATSYLRGVLALFDREPRPGDMGGAGGPGPLPEPLTERELEVLRLVSAGLSNQEIGERLFISLSTVKGHNQHIFGKLGVRRRTEAVARLRELGIL